MATGLVLGLAVSCGNDDKADSTTTTATASSSSDSGSSSGSSDTGNAKVDAYCNQVDKVATTAKKAFDEKDTELAKEAADQSKELAKQATGLATEVMKDPSLGSKIQECTKKLTQIGS